MRNTDQPEALSILPYSIIFIKSDILKKNIHRWLKLVGKKWIKEVSSDFICEEVVRLNLAIKPKTWTGKGRDCVKRCLAGAFLSGGRGATEEFRKTLFLCNSNGIKRATLHSIFRKRGWR